MQPTRIDPKVIGQLEGFTHQASFIYLPAEGVKAECMDAVHQWLEEQPDIVSGITQAGGNGMVIRILGNGAESLHNYLVTVSKMVAEFPINEPEKLIYAD
jgi:urease accessory protein